MVVVLVVLVVVVLEVDVLVLAATGTVVAVAGAWPSPSLAALLHPVAVRVITAASARAGRRGAWLTGCTLLVGCVR